MDAAGKLIAIAAYMIVMLLIGYYSMRRTKNVGDFFIGGRTIGPWVTAMAYGTTYFSAVLFVGFAGKLGWGFGMNALWIAVGNTLIGVLGVWLLFARPTREMTERLDAITMPEFLDARYGLPWLKPLSALVVFVFLVPYSASVYQGLAYLFEVNLGMPYGQVMALMAVLTGVYLVMGGYFAVATTDLVQGFLQILGVTLMVILVAEASGQGLFESIVLGADIANAPGLKFNPDALFPGWVMLASLVFMTSFGPLGLPQMVQKFYSIKDRRVITTGAVVATVFAGIVSLGAYYCGGLSHMFFSAETLPTLAGGKPDFDRIMPQLLHDHTPSWFSVIILLVILAASMSTLASLVLVSSAAVTVDLVGARDRRDKTSKKGLTFLRVMCGVFIGLSVLIASRKVDAIVTLMSMSWGALAGSFIGPYVWGILWRRTTAAGAAVGFVGGLVTAITLFVVWGGANSPISASVAMLVSLILVPVVSAITPALPAEKVALAFGDEQPAEQAAIQEAEQ